MRYPFRVVLIVFALAGAFAPLPPAWVEHAYWRSSYLAFQPYVTLTTNLLPFALLDVAVLILLGSFTFRLVRDWRASGVRRAGALALLRLITIATGIYILFLLTWGLNYRRVPLETKLEFDSARVTQHDARALATLAVDRLNAGHARAHAETFRPDALEYSFAEAQSLVGGERVAMTGRPKYSVAGFYFRLAAVDGMTVPVFLEVILNPDILPIERPSVLAHEWAHLAGYADESEASFIAWITGIRSSDPVAQYSAWLDAYSQAVNVLPRDVRAALPRLDEGPRKDLRDIAARYARSSPIVRRVARGAYDSYLRANRIEEGIDNYGTVLQLMLGTRFDDGWKPRLSAPRQTGSLAPSPRCERRPAA